MMRRISFSFAVMLACMVVWTLVGCHDDDEHVRDQPDGVYYEQPQNQNQYDNNSYDDHREYRGERRGWSVEIYRHGDDDDHDDDDHDDDDDD